MDYIIQYYKEGSFKREEARKVISYVRDYHLQNFEDLPKVLQNYLNKIKVLYIAEGLFQEKLVKKICSRTNKKLAAFVRKYLFPLIERLKEESNRNEYGEYYDRKDVIKLPSVTIRLKEKEIPYFDLSKNIPIRGVKFNYKTKSAEVEIVGSYERKTKKGDYYYLNFKAFAREFKDLVLIFFTYYTEKQYRYYKNAFRFKHSSEYSRSFCLAVNVQDFKRFENFKEKPKRYVVLQIKRNARLSEDQINTPIDLFEFLSQESVKVYKNFLVSLNLISPSYKVKKVKKELAEEEKRKKEEKKILNKLLKTFPELKENSYLCKVREVIYHGSKKYYLISCKKEANEKGSTFTADYREVILDEKGKPISDWFEDVVFLAEKKQCFIGKIYEKNKLATESGNLKKRAFFSLETGEKISEWFYFNPSIDLPEKLVKGKLADYLILESADDRKKACFLPYRRRKKSE